MVFSSGHPQIRINQLKPKRIFSELQTDISYSFHFVPVLKFSKRNYLDAKCYRNQAELITSNLGFEVGNSENSFTPLSDWSLVFAKE
jgi:hypothetical protein